MLAYMPKKARDFAQNADGLIDDVNRKLLSELQDDARLTVAELGRRVGLSSPAVAERLQRLEGAGAIKGYHARIDPRALGLFLPAVIRIRPAPRELHKVADWRSAPRRWSSACGSRARTASS